MKRALLSNTLITLALVLALLAGAAPAQAQTGPTNLTLFGGLATALNMTTSSESHTGLGSWSANHQTIEFYLTPASLGFSDLTIGDIENISFATKKAGGPGDVDWTFYIYTVKQEGDPSWYGVRLNAEPYFSINNQGAANQWNVWSSHAATNQLRFFDQAASGNFGTYTDPTLEQLQAVAGYTWPNETTKSYSSLPILAFRLGTGSAWSATFDGLVDSLTIIAKGQTVVVDLESVQPTTVYVDDSWTSGQDLGADKYFGSNAFSSIQDAVTAVADGGTVNIAEGTYTLTSGITVNKDITLQGAGIGKTIIQVSGTEHRISLTKAGATLKDVEIVKTDKAGTQNIIYISASNVTLDTISVHGQWVMGDGEVTRAVEATGGLTNVIIQNSTFYGLRQPGYLNSSQFTIENNYVAGTKGWVLEGADVNFVDNTWGSGAEANAVDIAILDEVSPELYPDLLAISAANNDARIEDQRVTPFVMTHVFVNAAANPSGANGYQTNPYLTIGEALPRVVSGGTIFVAAGEYELANTVIDRDMTITGADQATTIIRPVENTGSDGDARGWILVNPDVDFNLSGVTLDGAGKQIYQAIRTRGTGTIEKTIIKNIKFGQYLGFGVATFSDITFRNNELSNIERVGISVFGAGVTNALVDGNNFTGKGAGDWVDYGIEVGGGANATLTNNMITGNTGVAASDDSVSAAVLVSTYYGAGSAATITNNTFHGNTVGIAVGFDDKDTSVVVAEKNLIFDNEFGIQSTLAADTDASPNWWGSISGPAAGEIDGNVVYDPWCMNAACSAAVSGNEQGQVVIPDGASAGEIQTVLSNLSTGSTVVIPAGSFEKDGGLEIDVPGVTILLSDGTVIQNNSPCFQVNADHTRIIAEAGAKCVPTASSAGIEVANGVTDLVIEGLEIDGTGQAPTAGILFEGAVSDVIIANNYIHDVTLNGTQLNPALLFNVAPTGVFTVQGNLFQNTSGIAGEGLNLDAEYNSWGSYTVSQDMVVSGAGSTVDYEPYTHADLYLQSTGTPWANQVVTGQTITYQVYGNFQNVMGADFTLNYPGFLTVNSSSLGSAFANATLDTTVPGALTYHGYEMDTTAVSGEDVPIFSVTFSADAAGSGALDFDETSDAFSMAPASGPSNLIYAAALADGAVKVIDLPQFGSSGIPGPHVTGMSREFTVSLNNPATGGDFTPVQFRFTVQGADLGDIASFQYKAGESWLNMPLSPDGLGNLVGYFGPETGFPITAGYNATTTFRATFNNSGQYPVSIRLFDLSTSPATQLASHTATANVYLPPVLTEAGIAGPHVVGMSREFTVSLNNPTGGAAFDLASLRFTVEGADPADIASFQYKAGENWLDMPLESDGSNLVGYFGPETGFAVGAPYDATTTFRVTFNNAGQYPVTITVNDTTTDPDTMLAVETATAGVYPRPVLSSTNLAGPYLTGIQQEFQVQLTNLADGGTFTNALVRFTVAGAAAGDITSFQYLHEAQWLNMPLTPDGSNLVGYFGPTTGFLVDPGYDATTTFRVTFANAKTYPVTVELFDLTTDPDTRLSSMQQAAVVYGQPAITTSLAGPYLAGLEHEYTVSLTNPADGGNFLHVRGWFAIKNANLSEVAIQYLEVNDGLWYPLTLSQQGADVVGWFGPLGGFPMTNPYTGESSFRVTFSGDANRTFDYEFRLYDLDSNPDWVLTTLTGSVEVQANFTVTGTVSMQGRTTRASVPVTLQGDLVSAPYSANSIEQISNNLSFVQVVADTYTITTNQPRYLNVTSATATISASKTSLSPLELKGGNADSDIDIDVTDASEVGADYGLSGTENNGDVNFSGLVDIFDLALVGGNYGLTSGTAYTSWVP